MDEEQGGGNAPLEPRLRTYRAPENGFLRGEKCGTYLGKDCRGSRVKKRFPEREGERERPVECTCSKIER